MVIWWIIWRYELEKICCLATCAGIQRLHISNSVTRVCLTTTPFIVRNLGQKKAPPATFLKSLNIRLMWKWLDENQSLVVENRYIECRAKNICTENIIIVESLHILWRQDLKMTSCMTFAHWLQLLISGQGREGKLRLIGWVPIRYFKCASTSDRSQVKRSALAAVAAVLRRG